MVHLLVSSANPEDTSIISELNNALEGVWREAASAWRRDLIANRASGGTTQKGTQKYINAALDERLEEAGWTGRAGRWRRNDVLLRVSFRHYTTIGSDLFDALRVCKNEGVRKYILVYASYDALKIITPDDSKTICSIDHLEDVLSAAQGVIDVDVLPVKLSIDGELPQEVHREVYSPRRLDSPRGKIS